MTVNTKMTVIDVVHEALDSRRKEKLIEARYLVQTKCHQSGIDMLEFLFDEVFPLYSGVKTDKTEICPYCGKDDCKGDFGLRTHVSRIHKEKFEEFKQKYLL